jgi:hypothetical protein
MATGQSVEFEFVDNAEIKRILVDYWGQAQAAFNASAYAATVVLCGGILEGLLAWALERKEADARKQFPHEFKRKDGSERPISEWDLTTLINVNKRMELIGETSERLLRAVQGFRNFIHPYNLIQRSARPDKRLAEISSNTVGEVVRSIKGRLGGMS